MNISKTRAAVLVAAAVVLPISLAACSSSSSSDAAASASAAATEAAPAASATSSEQMVGGDPSTWSPVQLTLDQNGQTIDLKVGQVAIINGLPVNDDANKINVTSSDEAVVAPHSGDGTTENSGFQAVAPGTAQIIVMDEDPSGKNEAQPVVQYTVNVTE